MDQVRDWCVEHPVCVRQENCFQNRSISKLALPESCGIVCTSTAAAALVLPKPVLGAGKGKGSSKCEGDVALYWGIR